MLRITPLQQLLQQACTDCKLLESQGFKLRFLAPHSARLQRLADDATLREELTGFPLAIGATDGIANEDRPGDK